MTNQEVFERITQDATGIFSREGLKSKLESGRKLQIKMGADPSRPDLHLGHSVVLRKLKLLQDLGHDILFVIGDFTGMIGDPTGRSKTRPVLTFEQTRENGKTYFRQVTKILDADKTKIVYNSEWLSKMNFADVLQLAGKTTVARILERDDFSMRFRGGRPIGLHEMLYPLMQGYDSVALHADIEVGGSDQTFNLLVGRDLQKDYGEAPQEVVTFPLLPGLDGTEKMSKSLGNAVGLDEPPETMFEKCMKVPDPILKDYFRLTTDLPDAVYGPLLREDIRGAHVLYAKKIVTMYHGKEAAGDSFRRYAEVASGAIPESIKTVAADSNHRSLIELVKLAGLAGSNSEARRLILEGGIQVDGRTVRDLRFALPERGVVLRRGKNKFVKVVFKA